MMTLKLTDISDESDRIARQILKRKREWLEKFGQDVADEARAMQKDSSSPSAPGQPPNVHSPEPNLRTIEHQVDLENDSVRVGPVFIPSSPIRPALPGVMEKGGWIKVRRKVRSGRTVTVKQYVSARPHIKQAAEKAIEKMKYDIARKGIK